MDKITYYLGAGASANSIPIVSKMIFRLKDLIEYLESFLRDKRKFNSSEYTSLPIDITSNQELIKEIILDIEWLIKETEYHQTIDNLAKKYFVQEKIGDLTRLKRTLIVYFTLIQGINIPTSLQNVRIGRSHSYEKVEKRFDNLVACLINRQNGILSLNNRVKIISWNYDLQPELILKNYFDEYGIHQVKENCQIIPNRLTGKNAEENKLIDISKFALIKLNGNALFDYHSENKLPGQSLIFDEKESIGFLSKFLAEYKLLDKRNSSGGTKLLNFAWEEYDDNTYRNYNFNDILETAISVANQTNILIVIGYSFPYFNSNIDRYILSQMTDIKSVIIQDNNFEEIKNRVLDLVPAWKRFPELIKKAEVGSYYYIDPST